MKLELGTLKELEACSEQVELFEKLFGDSVEVTEELCLKHAGDFDWDFARQLLSGPARAEYDKVCGPALAEYNKVCGLALAEYDKVCGLALAEYDKVCGLALAEYDKVCGLAWAKAFNSKNN